MATLALPLAQATVTVDIISVPARTAAAHPFGVDLSLANDGAGRAVYVFGALYDRAEGPSGCGPATDGRFRGFTHMVQERVEVPANGVVAFPAPGARWLHQYQAEDVGSARDADFCVFVANASSGPLIEYESFDAIPLNVRASNAVPVASFAWEPEGPRAGESVRFRAEASDAEGDPLALAWDFGHFTARGRATAQEEAPAIAFHNAGEYVVTLVASDGMDEARATRSIVVADAGAPEPTPRGIPGVGALAVMAALAAGAARRRRG